MNRTTKYNLDSTNVNWIHTEDSSIMLECGTDDDALEILIDPSLFDSIRDAMTGAERVY